MAPNDNRAPTGPTARADGRAAAHTRLATAARGFYGAPPLHLLVLLGSFAVAGYAATRVLGDRSWPVVLLWFVGAVIGHDLVLFPLYAAADRTLRPLTASTRPRRVPMINYVRVPALGAGLTFLMFFPGIITQGAGTFMAATGQDQQPYLTRWLLLTAALCAVSAILYTVRWGRAARRPTPHDQRPPGPTSERGTTGE